MKRVENHKVSVHISIETKTLGDLFLSVKALVHSYSDPNICAG